MGQEFGGLQQKVIRALIVEDDPAFARMVVRTLASSAAPFETKVVDAVTDAQKEVESRRYNVVLLDLNLPDSAGVETVDAIIATTLAVPIVVLTGDEGMSQSVLDRGAHACIVKSAVTTEKLIEAVRLAVRSQLDGAVSLRRVYVRIDRVCEETREDFIAIQSALALLESKRLEPDQEVATATIRSKSRQIGQRIEGLREK